MLCDAPPPAVDATAPEVARAVLTAPAARPSLGDAMAAAMAAPAARRARKQPDLDLLFARAKADISAAVAAAAAAAAAAGGGKRAGAAEGAGAYVSPLGVRQQVSSPRIPARNLCAGACC